VIQLRLDTVPRTPGCYQFYEGDRCLYVGKAVSLRQRLGSYLALDRLEPRIRRMVERADRVEWLVMENETEALLCEAAMVKKLDPEYNILLREEHPYPSLALDTRSGVAQLRIWRGPKIPGVSVYGPWPNGTARRLHDAVLSVAPVRSCEPGKYRMHQRIGKPCMLYDINKCSAPCVPALDAGVHETNVEVVRKVLTGRSAAYRNELEQRMDDAAAGLRYEQAARLRDQIGAIEAVGDAQRLTTTGNGSFAVIGSAVDALGGAVCTVFVRDGAVVGIEFYILDSIEYEALEERAVVRAAVERHLTSETPEQCIIHSGAEIEGDLVEAHRLVCGNGAKLRGPRGVHEKDLVALAEQNAAESLRRSRSMRASNLDARREEIVKLQAALGLARAPLHIEAVDISHLGGAATVSTISVLKDGVPTPRLYRRYRLKEHGGNDYAAMREVLTRRCAEIADGAAAMDLLLIDGGKNQLAIAVEVLHEFGLHDRIEVASLAKRFEEVYRPGSGDPVVLERSNVALLLLQRARDETHRASNKFQQRVATQLRRKDYLDDVRGLGSRRKTRLLESLGGWRALEECERATLDLQTYIPAAVRDAVWAVLEERRSVRETATEPGKG
jgi:excinuclease ABC subunit C